MVTRRYNGTRDSIIYRNFSIISSVPAFSSGIFDHRVWNGYRRSYYIFPWDNLYPQVS